MADSGGLLGIDPSLLANLGMGLMAGAGYGSNAGQGLMQGMGNYYNQKMAKQDLALKQQQYGMNNLNMQMLLQQLPMISQALDQMGGLTGQGQQPQQPQQGPPPSLMPGSPVPQGANGVQSFPLASPQAPDAPQGSAPQAPQQPQGGAAPQGGQGPDPWKLYQSGVRLSAFPMTKDLGASQIKYAEAMLQNDPRFVTQTAVAKDQITQDQALLAQAQRSGNPTLMSGAYTKLLKDYGLVNISERNGNVTTLGGISPNDLGISSFQPDQGINATPSGVTAIPGAIPTAAQRAGAVSGAQSAAEYAPVYDKQGNLVSYAPRAATFSQPSAPGAAPGSAAGGAPNASGAAPAGLNRGLGPNASAQLATSGKGAGEYLGELQTQADNATQTNYALDQMATAGTSVNLGPGAPARQWVENAAASLGQQFGIAPPKELASYEELQKYGNQIAFAATRQMGSREAAQIVEMQLKSNPNAALVPEAFTGLVQSMRAMNSYVIAKNTAIQAAATGGADARQAASTWTAHIDPRVWDLSLGPELANKFAGQIGVTKISKALPVMANEDAISVMRNLNDSMRAQVLRGLPDSVKQEIIQGLQGARPVGATGSY